jgi:asparagine synthase (glutamine-hydrolysing)
MCGIAGIVRFDHEVVDPNVINQMAETMVHRGPDGRGRWICNSGRIGLAHQRLAIVDQNDRADQPMHLDQRLALVFNGEIYNYRKLKEDLEKTGVRFITESDSEVLIHLYQHHGTRCVDLIDGMFAFAIWDQEKKILFAARDRFGEKPFFYHQNNGGFFFASEMKALFATGIDRTLDPFLNGLYLTTGLLKHPSDAGATFYESIRSLPPAHTLVVQDEKVSIHRYWQLTESDPDGNQIEWISDFDRKLNQSVDLRLSVNVKSGIGLSGGIDSSSILQHAIRLQRKIHPVSAIFPGFKRNEEAYVHVLAKEFFLKPEWIVPQETDLTSELDKWLYHQEEPVSSSSAFVQYMVYRKAKESGIKVMLEGQGADELLAGYEHYISVYLRQLLSEKKWSAFHEIKQQFQAAKINFPWGIKHHAAAFFPTWAGRKIRSEKIKRTQTDWLAKDYRQYIDEESNKHFPFYAIHNLHTALREDLTGGRLEVLLRYADRNAMAHGIEVRLPFLDHKLVEWVHALPEEQLIAGGKTKWILRQSMKDRLPEKILNRTDKIAFEPPQAEWMKSSEMRKRLMESKQQLVDEHILDACILKRNADQLDAHAAQNFDWQILCIASIMNAAKG